jgi:uncharacterized protein
MLRLDLAKLARNGSAEVDVQVPADDPLWLDAGGPDAGVTFDGPVGVRLRASHAGTGEIVVRGTVEAALLQECRRCLKPVPGTLAEEVTMVFVPSTSENAEEDGDVRLFDDHAAELDLSDSVREELLLAIDLFVVCDPECKGLCPRCGTNRNVETCSCTTAEADPRWDALRALKEE